MVRQENRIEILNEAIHSRAQRQKWKIKYHHRGRKTTMKNELHNLTEDISRLYEDITQKTESLGQIDSITRLYDELQAQLQSISAEEIDLLQSQIRSTLEQMVGISKSLAVIKTLKVTFSDHNDMNEFAKKPQEPTSTRRSMEDR